MSIWKASTEPQPKAVDAVKEDNNWAKYSPKELRTPVSGVLKRKNPIADAVGEAKKNAIQNAETLMTKRQSIVEEHLRKVQFGFYFYFYYLTSFLFSFLLFPLFSIFFFFSLLSFPISYCNI